MYIETKKKDKSNMKKHLLGLPIVLQFTYDENKNSSFLDNKDNDPNSVQAIEKNIAITNTYDETNLIRDIDFMMDYAIECNAKKHTNQVLKENGEKVLTYGLVIDPKVLKQSQISSLECYLLWMVFNYDFDSKALFSIVKEVETQRSPYDSTMIFKSIPFFYENFLLTEYANIPYQYSDPRNQNTYDGKPLKSRTFFYSKLNTLLNDVLKRIKEKLEREATINLQDLGQNIYYDGEPHYVYDYKTGIGINVRYEGFKKISRTKDTGFLEETTTKKDVDKYVMVLPNGQSIDIDAFGYRIRDLAKLEEANPILSANQTDFLFASQTLYSYYGCILKDFQDLCVKLKAYKNAQANQKQSTKNAFFALFRSIMQRRIKGEIEELKSIRIDTNIFNNIKKYKYIVGIDGFYSPYYIKFLINSMALKKAMVDTFGSSVGLKEIEKLFDLKEIGVLFNLHLSEDFQSYRTSQLYELHEELGRRIDAYNAQLEEESKRQELAQNARRIMAIAPYLSNLLQTKQPIDMNLVSKLVPSFVFSNIKPPSVTSSSLTPQDQSQQAMSNDNLDDSNGDINGANQIEQNRRMAEEEKQKALQLEKQKIANANETKSNIIIWSTIGLIGAVGAGYYFYNKKKQEHQ